MFLDNIEGTLMKIEQTPDTRFKFEIWFDYTRKAINEIQEGTMLAVPNFSSNQTTRRYSILEVNTILPAHYAMEGNTSGFPGFVVEAAISASQDWETQDTTSTEDTTKIKIQAIPTNLEIEVVTSSGEANIGIEGNIPMLGAQVNVIDSEYTERIANNGIDQENEENLTVIGTAIKDDEVEILLRIEELYRTHFAVFGFTGVGKSNLLSTIVAKVFEDTDIPIKLVFFDMMSEYTGLLIDQLLDENIHGGILTLGRNTLPEGVFKYINDLTPNDGLDAAVTQLNRYTLLPKALVSLKDKMALALRDLIEDDKIRYYNESQSTSIYDFFFTKKTPWGKERRSQTHFNNRNTISRSALRTSLGGGVNYKTTYFNEVTSRLIREQIETALEADDTYQEDFAPVISKLEDIQYEIEGNYTASTTLNDLVDDLNNSEHNSLWIIQAHNPNDLRVFSRELGERLYELRRTNGAIEPLISIIFDEADEFIRRDATGTYIESAEIAQTIARRGRKFGIGLGIATQRIRYLDTNIMAQPHTYFVSKLPRKSDRDAVCEAFGVSEDMLNQTFKFKKGNWLLMSHDATGLEGIPIPIKTVNANERISEWLNENYPDSNT